MDCKKGKPKERNVVPYDNLIISTTLSKCLIPPNDEFKESTN